MNDLHNYYNYVIVKAWFGVLYGQYSTRGEVERPIQHEAKPSALLCLETSPRVLYCPYSTNKPCFKFYCIKRTIAHLETVRWRRLVKFNITIYHFHQLLHAGFLGVY